MDPLISIIVPIYNRDSYVEQLINTVKNQTYKNWELLLIDDNSSDKTARNIAFFAENDQRIKCVKNKHAKGASGARNTGLDIASGDYIAYQDSDDEWIQEHLATMVYYLEKYPNEIDLMSANPLRKNRSSGEVYSYDEIDLRSMTTEKLENAYVFDSKKTFEFQLFGRIITTQCIVAKREKIKALRWNENLKAATDNLYNLNIAYDQVKIGHLQEYHSVYWAHDDNITNCGGNHDNVRMEAVQKNFIEYWRIVLREFKLTKYQKAFAKKNLSETLAWHYAYGTLEPQGKYAECIPVYLEAFLIYPQNYRTLSSFFKSILKTMFK